MLLELLQDLTIPLLVASLIGKLIKEKTDVSNQLIPILNVVVQMVGRLLVEISPAEASIFGDALSLGRGVFIDSILATILATGVHSGGKASGRAFKQSILPSLIRQLKRFASR